MLLNRERWLTGLFFVAVFAYFSPSSDSGDGSMKVDVAAAPVEMAADRESGEREPEMRFPEDPVWLEALPVGRDVKRPDTVFGPHFDLYGYFPDRSCFLGMCFLGLIVATCSGVERAYFLGPKNASYEPLGVFLRTVRRFAANILRWLANEL